MAKYYYDTGVFGYFLFSGDLDHKYSPLKIKSAYASTFCDEELIYVYMQKGKFSDFDLNLSFVQITEKIVSTSALFTYDNIDLSDIHQKFNYMMGSLAQNNIDLRSDFIAYQKKNGSGVLKPLNGMDWLHLAAADLLECDTFLTTDKGFEYLSKVWMHIKLNKVRKIIILSSDKELKEIDKILLE